MLAWGYKVVDLGASYPCIYGKGNWKAKKFDVGKIIKRGRSKGAAEELHYCIRVNGMMPSIDLTE